jgi:hypothetical protein
MHYVTVLPPVLLGARKRLTERAREADSGAFEPVLLLGPSVAADARQAVPGW